MPAKPATIPVGFGHEQNGEPLTDSIAIIQSLDAEGGAQRLAELAAEEHALLVLPRSARARQQAQRCRQKRDGRDDRR